MHQPNHSGPYENSDDAAVDDVRARDLTSPGGSPGREGSPAYPHRVSAPDGDVPIPAVVSGVAHSITSLVLFARRRRVQYAVFIALVIGSFLCGIAILFSL